MDLLIEKDDKRTYLSRYKVITTSFEESAPSVNRNNTQIQYRNGNVDFGGWNESKTIDYVGYYRADDLEDEEYLRERIYALLSDPDGYYITQLKNDNDNSFERPGETSGDYFDKQVNRPSHKRFYVYASSLESELVGSYGGHVLYKISATFTTMKLPYGESVPRDLDVKPNVPYCGRNLLLDTGFNNLPQYWPSRAGAVNGTFNGHNVYYYDATTITGDYTNVLQQPIYDPALTNNRVLPSHWYTLSFYAKGVGQMTTYVYGSFVDSSAGSYIDGAKEGHINPDGSNVWDLTDDWTRHTYAFKSKSSFPDTGVQNVLWRLYNGNKAYICMLKLETGTTATPYSPAPEDPDYNEWYLDTYYNTNNLAIPYAGTVPCNQLEQGFAVEFAAKEAGSRLVIDVNGTELTYSGQVYADDVFKLSGYEYTKNGISIVKDTNKAYFKLLPGVANKISSSLAGEIRILDYQDLYA